MRSFLILISSLLLLGCSGHSENRTAISGNWIDEQRRQNYVAAHPNISEEAKRDILNGVIQIGMTKEMVIAAWGHPQEIQRSGDFSGGMEAWMYQGALLSFEYGVFIGFREHCCSE